MDLDFHIIFLACFYQLKMTTSNRNYWAIVDPDFGDDNSGDNGSFTLAINVLADMDANDTALVQFQVGSGGSAQADVYNESYFTGFLAC